ncbi:MAG: LptF/LptG family permease [Bacteroidota bacterium]|nr:LptF/LptG family permease [Candidatus Kapabacteria bacterium]MCS7303161.1 LptF/LptG family permease [Candidatus Kapabacteria bacterium]MCX7937365.1 LptF/LptG family permease [Chlorobiota bacterium]MDW8075858.1 LptF/LptG family permease [Bacteroidota bacterium]MDW8271822.1 LptF/LptG family permease [Bacteroidota bacterium]
MLILPRYILRAHLGPFLFGASVVMFLFLMQFLLRVLDDLVGKGLSAMVIAHLIVVNLAWMVVLAVPIGVLFSTLMAFGKLAQTHEVTAMKAGGVSLFQMMAPVIAMGAILSGAVFWFNDAVLPDANHRAKTLLMDIQRKKPAFVLQEGQFTSQLEGYTILVRRLDSTQSRLWGVTIYDRRDLNRMTIVNADSGVLRFSPSYRYILLTLYHGEVHQQSRLRQGDYRFIRFEQQEIIIPAYGFLLERSSEGAVSRGDREMRIRDMEEIVRLARHRQNTQRAVIEQTIDEHISRLLSASPAPPDPHTWNESLAVLTSQIGSAAAQYDDADMQARQYEVEIQKKYAIPLACLVFVLVGCPLGIRTRGGSFGISALISLGFYILYWACLIGGEKLADRQYVSPLIVWSANAIIGMMGVVLMLTTANESFHLRTLFRVRKS